jgi:hypothetical protein
MDPRRRAGRLTGAVADRARLIGAGLVLVAVVAGALLRHADVDLGAATAPMFWVRFAEHYRGLAPAPPWWPLAPLLMALLLLRAHGLPAAVFLTGAFAVALLARLGLNTAQFGRDEWSWPLRRPNSLVTEYPAAYARVDGHVTAFIDRFAELVPTLPVHPSGHPVGATLAFYEVDRATGGATHTALLLSVLGAVAVVPTYLLGRLLADDRSGRIAAVLFALAPQTLLYGTTSYDAAFVPIAALVAWLLLRRSLVLGAVLAAAAFLLSYALALVPVFAILAARRRERWRIALACAAAVAALLALLALALGYDPIGAVRATHDAYERGIGGRRPYAYWVVGGPAAFLVVLGPLVAERALRGVELRERAAVALTACVALAAVSGVIEAEVERILQFLTPMAAAAAAVQVRSRRWLVAGLALGVAEACVIELLWDTTF